MSWKKIEESENFIGILLENNNGISTWKIVAELLRTTVSALEKQLA